MRLDPPNVLLNKAGEDEHLASLVLHDSTVSHEQIGFLCQQGVEKAIKAVLSANDIRYRRTHDLAELIDLMKENNLAFPSSLEASVLLTPFAAEMRYDYLPPEAESDSSFDRDQAIQFVRNAIDWAKGVVSGSREPEIHQDAKKQTSTITLRLGHSPDPDDAFMFYALAKGKIPTGPYRFEHILQDIQTLNQRAMSGELEITAISIHAYPYVAGKYALTSCGSSMGDKYGPMIIAPKPMTIDELRGKRIAIPGELTTAFLALQLCLGKAGKTFEYDVVMFDEIPAAVKSGKFDAGLIIHEGQLTYQQLGLHLVVDLGQWWYEKTQLPLPLGGNCIRKDLGPKVCQEVTDILKQSIQYSLDHRAEAVEYALQFGRDLDRDLADRFVGMYVNDWTLDYGKRGLEAIETLLKQGAQASLVPSCNRIELIQAR